MIAADYLCTECGEIQERRVDSPAPDVIECEYCGEEAHWMPWIPSPGPSAVAASVARGPVAKPASKMFCDTRALGEGQSLAEWKADRRKLYAERRHAERKRGE